MKLLLTVKCNLRPFFSCNQICKGMWWELHNFWLSITERDTFNMIYYVYLSSWRNKTFENCGWFIILCLLKGWLCCSSSAWTFYLIKWAICLSFVCGCIVYKCIWLYVEWTPGRIASAYAGANGDPAKFPKCKWIPMKR